MSAAEVDAAPVVSLPANGVGEPISPPRSRRWWQGALSLAGLVGLVVLVRSLPHADWAALMARVGPALPILAAIALGWMALYARALRVILAGTVAWVPLVRNRFVGEAYNVAMPFGDVGGDPFRIMDLSARVGAVAAVRAIVFDRLVYVTGGFIFSALGSALAVHAYAWDARLRPLLLGYIVFALAVALVLSLLTTRPWMASTIGRVLRLMKVPMPELPPPLSARTFLRALGWNLLARAGVLLEIGVLLAALGQPVRVEAVVTITAVVGVAGILFPFVPGGIGVNEGAAVLALTVTGYGETLGLAIGLSRRVRQLLLAAVGVAVHALGYPRASARVRMRRSMRRLLFRGRTNAGHDERPGTRSSV